MADITAAIVKELRERTGIGMMKCKEALQETEGDLDRAVDYLRTHGMAAVEKRSGREAREGLVTSYIHPGNRLGVLLEVNCETDFVARTDDFQQFAKDVAMHVAAEQPTAVIGEGGSGGAIATATANKVIMLEHAIYTVISPEGAASILWRDSSRAKEAATGMKITATDLERFGIIDGIVTEPVGGAHREPQATILATGDAIDEALGSLDNLPPDEIRRQRRDKYLAIGRSL